VISRTPFIPHTLAELTEQRVFPKPLPEVFYDQMLADYAKLSDVNVSRITYQSDGLTINGLMALPGTVTSHPVMIYNRGGSREYGKLTLLSVMRSMVPFARAGYMVFASNYRGAEGGEGMEEFGGKDVNDVLNLLALAQNEPGFDGKNRFMLGHSRGGMMTYLAMKHGAKLNAAIALAGMADVGGISRAPHMEEKVFRRLIPNYDRAKEALLRERSAIYWPEKITAPLLMLHGDKDEAISPDESIALSQKLSALGKPNELHIYPGANHALVRVWDDVVARSLAWMERYRT
jgi:dipeptidyl aminopeptidase/acylaminoacyl peptidase